MRGNCGLCSEPRELRDSHIVPALVARWIKKDAPGTLFVNLASGQARQDISTRALFCDSCEQRFSTWEGHFRNRVFDAHFKQRTNFERGEWLTRFATSLAFRVGLVTLPLVDVGSVGRKAQCEGIFEQWRQYLLAPAGARPPTVHDLFFLNGRNVEPPLDIRPEVTARYLIESIDATLIASKDILAVYTKLPAMLFWSPIAPQDRSGWRGTRVNGTGTIRANKQVVASPLLTRLVQQRVREVAARIGLQKRGKPHNKEMQRTAHGKAERRR